MCRVKSSEDCYHDDSGSLVRKGNQMNAFQLPVVNPPLKGFCGGPIHFPSPASMKKRSLGFTAILSSCSAKTFWRTAGSTILIFRGKPNELNFNNPFLLTCSVNYTLLESLALDVWPKFFADQIQNGYYCVVFLDESRLSPAASYQREPFPHHLFYTVMIGTKGSSKRRCSIVREYTAICRSRSGSFRTPFSP